jgi:hypothetical protein
MRRLTVFAALLFTFSLPVLAQAGWHGVVDQKLPLMGHRNWVLIVDSAYPLYSSPGVDVVETNADELEVIKYVLGALNNSIHVRPDVLMDAELKYVPEPDAPGVTAFKAEADKVLAGHSIESLPHEKLLAELDQASKVYRVLVLKTRMTVPYTSVFLRLNCKYWSDEAEKRLRQKMATSTANGQ